MGKAIIIHKNVYVFDDSKVNYYLKKKNGAQLCQRRLGHINFDILIRVSKMGVVRGFPRLSRPDN